MMSRKFVALASAAIAASVAGVAAQPAAAQAASGISVSVACESITFNNSAVSSAHSVHEGVDYEGNVVTVSGGGSQSMTLPAGTYTWTASLDDADVPQSGRVVVPSCATADPVRGQVGDENGDGRSDVFGLTAAGELYYYSVRPETTLNAGVRVATGWTTTDWMARAPETVTPTLDWANALITHRTDGTMWLYPDLGSGRIGTGVQIASGMTGYTNFAITQTNSFDSFGGHELMATKAGVRYSWILDNSGAGDVLTPNGSLGPSSDVRSVVMPHFDADGFADELDIDPTGRLMQVTNTPTQDAVRKQIGGGWGAMQIVTCPGDLDGNGYSDLIARRADGNLYVYKNTNGLFGVAMQIGARWNGITLLA